jgi:hypothetical protein
VLVAKKHTHRHEFEHFHTRLDASPHELQRLVGAVDLAAGASARRSERVENRALHLSRPDDEYDSAIPMKGRFVANYSMTPYSFSLYPRNARGGERRPIADLDGNGLELRSIIDDLLGRYEGEDLTPGQDDDSRSFRVARLYKYELFTFVEFGVGRSGIAGTLHQNNGTRIGYTPDEHNESLIRGMFVFPENGHEAYWLSERAGNNSAYSHLESVLLRGIRVSVPDLTVKVAPVADWEAVRAWSSTVLVQELRFDAPRDGGSSQAIDVNGFHGEVRVTVKPRGLALNRIVGDDGPNRDAVYGYLSSSPLVASSGMSVDSIIGAGWGAQVAFKNPAGRQRSFGLSLEDAGPALVYQVGSDAPGRPRSYRPEDDEFARTCSDFFVDVRGRLPVGANVASNITERIL